MKRSSNFKKALVLVAMLSLILVIFAGCGKTATDEFNQFVPPSSNVVKSEETAEGIKTPVSGQTALELMFDSIANARAVQKDANLIDFSFAPFINITNNGKTKRVIFDVKGSIDTKVNDNSVYSMEIITEEAGREDITILGVYGVDGKVYIDKNNYETGAAVHRYVVDDMDLSIIINALQGVIDQLDMSGFLNGFDVGKLMSKLGLSSELTGTLSNFVKLDGTLIELITSLVVSGQDPANTCYILDKGKGVSEIVMPVSLNGLINSSVFGTLISGFLDDASPLVSGIVNFLIGDVLRGERTMNFYIHAETKDDIFQKASFKAINKKGNNVNEVELGIGSLAFSKASSYAEVLKEEPTIKNLVKTDRTDYSFTTLSADVKIDLNLYDHTYYLGDVDLAIGNAIAGLLSGVDATVWSRTPIEITDDTVISLWLSLRAEIDLKNNDNTRIMLELRGSEDHKLRLGAYYQGGSDSDGNDTSALYIDLSGMGAPEKVMVSTYDTFELSTSVKTVDGVSTVNGVKVEVRGTNYVKSGDGYRVAAVGENAEYTKVTRRLNLNEIIVGALNKYIPQIPDLLSIVNGLIYKDEASAAALLEVNDKEYDTSVVGDTTVDMQLFADKIASGDIIIPHLGSNADNAVAMADEEVDILGLITGALGCAVITKGDTTLSLQSLGIYLTQDVIDSIFVGALGISLPITKLNLVLKQTTDEGWLLDVDAAMAKKHDDGSVEELLDASVEVFINYGNPDKAFKPYINGLGLKSIANGGEYIDLDFFRRGDTGILDNMMVNIALDLNVKFNATAGTPDLSPIGQLLAGLVLQLQVTDDVAFDLDVKISANANIMAIVGLIKGTSDITQLLSTLDAKIDIVSNKAESSNLAIRLYLTNGILYLEAPGLGFDKKFCINLGDILGGNFKLFGHDPAASSATAAEYLPDNTVEERDVDIVGILIAAIKGVNLGENADGNTTLEVKLAEGLIMSLMEILGLDFTGVEPITLSDDSGISITLDGLNLSELWLQVNLGLCQGEGEMGLGIGLGHIGIGVGTTELLENADGTKMTAAQKASYLSEFGDLMKGETVTIGLQLEIDTYLKAKEISLENMLGALLADASLGNINVLDEINGGLNLTIMAELDLGTVPDRNKTKIMIELRKVSDMSVLFGIYYSDGVLYVQGKEGGGVFQPSAVDLNLVELIYGLVYPATPAALSASDEAVATADLDLSKLNPMILLGSKGLQIKLLEGISQLLVGLIVGDFADYIAPAYEPVEGATADVIANAVQDGAGNPNQYALVEGAYVRVTAENATELADATKYYLMNNGSWKYYVYSGDMASDNEIYVNAYRESGVATDPATRFQKSAEKYVFFNDEFIEYEEGVHSSNALYIKATEYFYVPVSDVTDSADAAALMNFVVGTDTEPKYYVLSGSAYVEITADNEALYEDAVKFYKMPYKLAKTINNLDVPNIANYGANGYVAAYSEDNLATYIRVAASSEDLYLYELYSTGSVMKNGAEVSINMPELGVAIAIGKMTAGDVSVGGNDFGGIGIGIFFSEPGKVDDPTANLAIKLGNIMFSDAKFVAAVNEGIDNPEDKIESFGGYIDAIAEKLGAPLNTGLTVYLQLEAALKLGATATPEGGEDVSWAVGDIVSSFVSDEGGDPADQDATMAVLMSLVKKLLITFQVTPDGASAGIENVTGLRIAANLNLTGLLDGSLDTSDVLGLIIGLLSKSEVAIEIFDDYAYKASAHRIIGLYIREGVLYISINGATTESLMVNTNFKIEISRLMNLIAPLLEKDDTEAVTASDAQAAADIGSILGIVAGVVSSIDINNHSLTVNFGTQLLNVLVSLIAGVEGVKLPELNAENSKLIFDTDDPNHMFLKLGLGIDPVLLWVELGALELGLAPNGEVIPEDFDASAYKTIGEFAENISLDLEIGLSLGMHEGIVPVGDLLSAILTALGTDFNLPLDIDVEEEMEIDLAVQLAGNLNLNELEKSDFKLAIVNKAYGANKTLLGMYFRYNAEAGVPELYVETNFASQKGVPTKWKIEDFNLLDSLLGETTKYLIGILDSQVASPAALAASDATPEQTAEIVLALAAHTIELQIAGDIIVSLLDSLIEGGIPEDIEEMINDLALDAKVTIKTQPVQVQINLGTKYFNVGLGINKMQISLSPLDVFEGIDFTTGWTSDDEAMSVDLGLRMNYEIANGVYGLDSVITDISKAQLFGTDSLATIAKLLQAITLDVVAKNTKGYIDVEIIINVLVGKMNEVLPAAGLAIADLIRGKLDEHYVSGGEKFDIVSILSFVEAGIMLDLNGRTVSISLVDGYVCFALENIGGDNFKISLAKLISGIGGLTSSALSASSATAAATDLSGILGILGSAFAGISMSRDADYSGGIGEGLDVVLAPQLLQMLFEGLLADLLGMSYNEESKTFFSAETLKMFTLANPFVTERELAGREASDNYYEQVVENEFIAFDATLASHLGYQKLAKVAELRPEKITFAQAEAMYKVDKKTLFYLKSDGLLGESYDEYELYPTLFVMTAADTYEEVTAENATTYANAKKYVKGGLLGTSYEEYVKPTELYIYVDKTEKEYFEYNRLTSLHAAYLKAGLDSETPVLYINATPDEDNPTYKACEYRRNAEETSYEINVGTTTADWKDISKVENLYLYYLPMRYINLETAPADYSGSVYVKYKGEYVELDSELEAELAPDLYVYIPGWVATGTQVKVDGYVLVDESNADDEAIINAPKFVRKTTISYKRVTLVDEKRYVFVENAYAEYDAENEAHAELELYGKTGESTYALLYRKVDHSGITYSKAKGLGIKLLFADYNGRNGFMFSTDMDARFAIVGGRKAVLPKNAAGEVMAVADFTSLDKASEGMFYLSLTTELGMTGVDGTVVLADLLSDVLVKEDSFITDEDITALKTLGDIALDIGAFDSTSKIKLTVGANLGKLVSALTAEKIDIAALIGGLELAIETVCTEPLGENYGENEHYVGEKSTEPGHENDIHYNYGDIKGGVYLYNNTLYIEYIGKDDIFAMSISDLLGALGTSSAAQAAEDVIRANPAMLQIIIGEYMTFGDVAASGFAIKLTTELVETLLAQLLGINLDIEGTLQRLEAEVTVNVAAPLFTGVDETIYAKVGDFYVDVDDPEFDVTSAEGYDSMYPDMYTRYVKNDANEYTEQKYAFSADALNIGIGLGISTLDVAIDIGNFDIGLAYNKYVEILNPDDYDGQVYVQVNRGTEEALDFVYEPFNEDNAEHAAATTFYMCDNPVIPDKVKAHVVPEEAIFDLALNLDLGIEFINNDNVNDRVFDIGAFVNELIPTAKLPNNVLNLTIPEDGVELKLSLYIAIGLNLSALNKTVAEISIKGQIISNAGTEYEQKTLAAIYFKEGNLLIDLDGLGFGKVKITGLMLTSLLGMPSDSSGWDVIMGLINGTLSIGSSAEASDALSASAKAAGTPAAAASISISKSRIAIELTSYIVKWLIGYTDVSGDHMMHFTKIADEDLAGFEGVKYVILPYEVYDAEVPAHAALTKYVKLDNYVVYNDKDPEHVLAATDKGIYKYADILGLDAETAKLINMLGVEALLEIKTKPFLEVNLNASVAALLGINISINSVQLGNTGVVSKFYTTDNTEPEVTVDDYPVTAAHFRGKPATADPSILDYFEIQLDTLALSLQLDLNAILTDAMFVDDLTIGSVGEGIKGLSVIINAEVKVGALINMLGGDIGSLDTAALVSQILPMIKAQISIVKASNGVEVLGIYVIDGSIKVLLEGMGLPNIDISSAFLMELIGTLGSSSGALSASGEEEEEGITLGKVLGGIVGAITLSEKALKIALCNDYLINLFGILLGFKTETDGAGNVHYVIKPGYYLDDALPTPNEVLADDDTFFSGIKLNLGNLKNSYSQIGEDEKYYGTKYVRSGEAPNFIYEKYDASEHTTATTFYKNSREGLLQVDLDMFAAHLNVDLMFPELGFNKNIIETPVATYVQADKMNSLSLALRGQLKIDENGNGAVLGNILRGVVGELSTLLVIEDDIDLRFEIALALDFGFNTNNSFFDIQGLNLQIALRRATTSNVGGVSTETLTDVLIIFYDGDEQALYLDLSHLFKKQDPDGSRKLGKLKLSGIDLIGLLGGLLGGSSSISDAVSAATEEQKNAWGDAEHSTLYVPATDANSAAPLEYVRVLTLDEDDNPVKKYVSYALGSGEKLYVNTAAEGTPAVYVEYNADSHANMACFVKVGAEYKALYVSVGNNYVAYRASDVANTHKAKYTLENVYEYAVYDATDVAHNGLTHYVKIYNKTLSANQYVEYDATAKAPFKFVNTAATGASAVYQAYNIDNPAHNGKELYVRVLAANGKYAYYSINSYPDKWAAPARYVFVEDKYVKLYDGSIYVNTAGEGEPAVYVTYDESDASHATLTQYRRLVGDKYVAIPEGGFSEYILTSVNNIPAIWSVLGKSSFAINITGSVVMGLIGMLVDNSADWAGYIPTLALSLVLESDPQLIGINISILDEYNDFDSALGLHLNIFGFDHAKGNGSELGFKYTGANNAQVKTTKYNDISMTEANKEKFRDFAYLDLNRLLSASDILDVLFESLFFNTDTNEGLTSINDTLYLNASLTLVGHATETGDTPYDWAAFLAGMLGLSAEDIRVMLDVEYDGTVGADNIWTDLTIDIAAAINAEKLIGGLLDGSGLSLEGTEIQLTINTSSPILSSGVNRKIVITIIGDEGNGLSGIYLDFSGFHDKGENGLGKHKLSIDLAGILGGLVSEASASAETVDTGLLDAKLFGILDSILGEVKLGGGKITVSLKETFLGDLLNALIDGANVNSDASIVTGDIYIDIRNLEIGAMLYVGNVFEAPADDGSMADVTIGLKIGGINLDKPATYSATEGTFITAASRSTYKNLLDLQLDLDIDLKIYYDSEGTSATNPAISLNELLDLVGGLLNMGELFSNPNFQIKVAEGGIDAIYTAKLSAHLDLGMITGRKALTNEVLVVSLELFRQTDAKPTPEKRLGVYLDGSDIYIDLSALGLPKLSVTGVNLGDLLKEALGPTLNSLSGEGSSASDALAAGEIRTEDFIERWGETLLAGAAYPYMTAVFRSEGFAFGLNFKLINAVLEALGPALGTSIQLPDLGDIALILDFEGHENPDGSHDGTLIPKIILRMSNSLFVGIDIDRFIINGNHPTAESRALNTYNAIGASDYTSVYDVASGQIGLARVNLGLDIAIKQQGHNALESDPNYADSFEFYLWALISGLLKSDTIDFDFNILESAPIGYNLKLRASLNIGLLIGALSGIVDSSAGTWWDEVELFLEMTPLGYDNSPVLSLYKQRGSGDVYADLSGLSLFKVKIVGLGGLLSGLVSSSSALSAGDAEAAADIPANLTITLGQEGIAIDIGTGVIEGILQLLKGTLNIGSKTYTKGSHSATFTTIDLGEMSIPIPKLDSDAALHLEIKYAVGGKALGLTIGLGLDDLGNKMDISINNFFLGVDNKDNSTDFVNLGATNGVINTNVPEADQAFHDIRTNENSYSGLILNDAFGINLTNILGGVFASIDPNIAIKWNKHNTYNTATDSNATEADASYAIINIRRTTTSDTNSSGDSTGAGKVQIEIATSTTPLQVNAQGYVKKTNGNDPDRSIFAWLFNGALWVDIGNISTATGGVLGAIIGSVAGMDLSQIRALDLDLMGLIGGLASSDEQAVSSEEGALTATSDAVASAESGGILDVITGIIAGIEINWWYNPSVPGKERGNYSGAGNSKDISTIRININPKGFNELLYSLYYLLYGLYAEEINGGFATNECNYSDADEFSKLTAATKKAIVTTGTPTGSTMSATDANTNKSYRCVGAQPYCQAYLQDFAGGFLSDMVGATVADMLKSTGLLSNILAAVLGALLPLPILDETGAAPSYIEIVLDKSQINSIGVIRELGVYLNKNKAQEQGTSYQLIDVANVNNCAEIIITFGESLELRSVTGVRAYDTFGGYASGATIPKNTAVSTTVVVEDPSNPVELSAASLSANSALIQKVDADFYGRNYNSKGNTSSDWGTLGGTPVVWDTSNVILEPGRTSTITGYAINYPVMTANVRVLPLTDFSKLYGYIDSNGKFVSANRIVVDPTVNPQSNVLAGHTATVASLPDMIVILRKDGKLQLLDTEYSAENDYVKVAIDGDEYIPVGKFGWVEPKRAEIAGGGVYEVNFWYQTGVSSRISRTITVEYKNTTIASATLPEGDKFDILSGGSARDFLTAKGNLDIIANLGLGKIAVADCTTDVKTGIISYTGNDGSTYVLTPQTVTGLEVRHGTFVRKVNGVQTHSGAYYYEADSSAASGISALLGGLLGSSETTDSGKYVLMGDSVSLSELLSENTKIVAVNAEGNDTYTYTFAFDNYDANNNVYTYSYTRSLGNVTTSGTCTLVEGSFVISSSIKIATSAVNSYRYTDGAYTYVFTSVNSFGTRADGTYLYYKAGTLLSSGKYLFNGSNNTFELLYEAEEINAGATYSANLSKEGIAYTLTPKLAEGATDNRTAGGKFTTDDGRSGTYTYTAVEDANGYYTMSFARGTFNIGNLQKASQTFVRTSGGAWTYTLTPYADYGVTCGGTFTVANEDSSISFNGTYSFDATTASYYLKVIDPNALNVIDVKLANGRTATVEVLEWKYDDLKFDITNPEMGVSGSVIAVVNLFESELIADSVSYRVINSKQEIEIDVSTLRYQMNGLTDGDVAFNQYNELFVEAEDGTYVFATENRYVAYDESNTAHAALDKYVVDENVYVKLDDTNATKYADVDTYPRYVINSASGYVLYDADVHGAEIQRYNANIFTLNEVFVNVKYRAIGRVSEEFDKNDFTFYTDAFKTPEGKDVKMFIVPALTRNSDMRIGVTADYKAIDGAYSQDFGFSIVVTPKTVSKVVVKIAKNSNEADILAKTTGTAYFTDGTTMKDIAIHVAKYIKVTDDNSNFYKDVKKYVISESGEYIELTPILEAAYAKADKYVIVVPELNNEAGVYKGYADVYLGRAEYLAYDSSDEAQKTLTKYVLIEGNYVVFDEEDAAHEELTQYVKNVAYLQEQVTLEIRAY